MEGLRRADLGAVLDFVVDISEMEFEQPFPPELVARLTALVPSPGLVYRESDLQARRTPLMVDEIGPFQDRDDERYWISGPCPITDYRRTTGDLAAMRLADVMGKRRFRETSIYQDYFRADLVEHLLDVGLAAAPEWQRSFLFCRQRGDGEFSERDRLVLDVLRPHFAHLEAEAALRRRLAEVLRVADDEPEPARYGDLTAREREVVTLVAEGKTNAQIASELWVSPGTVKKHLENVYAKLGVGRRAAAVTYLRRQRLPGSASRSVGPDLS